MAAESDPDLAPTFAYVTPVPATSRQGGRPDYGSTARAKYPTEQTQGIAKLIASYTFSVRICKQFRNSLWALVGVR